MLRSGLMLLVLAALSIAVITSTGCSGPDAGGKKKSSLTTDSK